LRGLNTGFFQRRKKVANDGNGHNGLIDLYVF
jgi:hypothetical protein